MVKSWVFDIFNYPYGADPEAFDPAKAQELYDWHFDSWLKLEELGYDGLFFSEHHFTAYNVSPSPNLLVAALAKRTSRMRLGVMGNIIPFHNPRRLAEEIAMLDYLTDGRLEVGLGRGVDEQEFVKEGVSMPTTRGYFQEGIELMHKAWRQPVFSHHGEHFNYDGVTIWPRPLQQPNPPVWLLTLSPSTIELCGTQGYKCTSAFQTVEKTKEAFDLYRRAADKAGHKPGADDFGLMRNVFVADTDKEAREIAEPALEVLFGLFRDAAIFKDLDNLPAGYEFYSSFFRPFVGTGHTDWNALIEAGIMCVGSPSTVRDQLLSQARALQCGNFFSWNSFGHLTPEQTIGSYELYAKEVMPALHELDLD
ncbi:LLM class flavin-dependent oxidoreductase [Saccharopolyspora phatthalungensis]|uniref:Alkanesulfonate monooxygenase SsuD/methylene tetrahydromethanopterin reductase-like flavin-dependent oxidoreductase (Luciferase family) n=1 Tax=Saccharopolyspora phatthalungensis TaxID=664693 RepID=A0A840QEP4_9PSEU|nr:LLM class flavin-dependent oxidoreductase [Saccharopolyspora phatthalungensis]MBB5158896.1 alkanesulfonate monooxygenase SsuD/methylene tetrahydromethanopterin reductase-like flavin-dependent oxidoreductase (luciferase family) [Saccharopolyspora phatthalungensis]